MAMGRPPNPNKRKRPDIDIDELVRMYVVEGLSIDKIGLTVGASGETVRRRLLKAGVLMRRPGRSRTDGREAIDWQSLVLPRAIEIAESYDTPVLLRQIYYRLVSEQLIPNEIEAYNGLSTTSTEWRRQDRFPDLLDTTRTIDVDRGFGSPRKALDWLVSAYSLDHTDGQEHSIYLVCEKRTVAEQFRLWYGDRSIPIVCLAGGPSQTYIEEIRRDISGDSKTHGRRHPVGLYAGSFDASSEAVERDFLKRCGVTWDDWQRVVLTERQVAEYELPENTSTRSDSNKAKVVPRYGRNVQVEVDALDPAVMRQLFADAIASYWDPVAHAAVLEREEGDTRRDSTKPGVE